MGEAAGEYRRWGNRMAHLFCKAHSRSRANARDEGWVVLMLDAAGVLLSPSPPVALHAPVARDRVEGALDVLVVRDESRDDAWVLLAATHRGVEINGLPLNEGIRVLAHGDEVRIAGEGTFFYSTETLPAITAFPGRDSACMRCKLLLAPGKPAVRCPVCTIWHHQSAEDGLTCWTGFERCANCGHTTAMDEGYRFSPEDL